MRVFVSNISDLMPRYRSSSLCTCCRLPFFPSNLYSARINIRRDFFPPFQAFIVCEHFSFVFAGQTAPHRKKIKYVNRIYARVKCWQVVFCSLVHIFATCSFFFVFCVFVLDVDVDVKNGFEVHCSCYETAKELHSSCVLQFFGFDIIPECLTIAFNFNRKIITNSIRGQ